MVAPTSVLRHMIIAAVVSERGEEICGVSGKYGPQEESLHESGEESL
jgi:hypothetical protein